ncbi:MAG: DNA-3-methyladenine glycosylase I [Lentisphaeria bacterium]|nr:DNA-3-methyladenine glycosylase I [Lentisphaeria bacterium]
MTFPERKRCRWVNLKNPLYVAYHDTEWGVPVQDDHTLYELLILESFQAGLSWECVLNKRDAFRRAYDDFDPEKVVRYDEQKIASLLADPGLIRNRLKIRASIRNSRIFQEIRQEYGSFYAYLRRFAGNGVIVEPYDRQTTSPLSDAISKDLHKRGMRFVGSTIIYSYLQAVGIINGHGTECDFCAGKKC